MYIDHLKDEIYQSSILHVVLIEHVKPNQFYLVNTNKIRVNEFYFVATTFILWEQLLFRGYDFYLLGKTFISWPRIKKNISSKCPMAATVVSFNSMQTIFYINNQ